MPAQKKTTKKQDVVVGPEVQVLDPQISDPVDDKKRLSLVGNIHISRARCEWHFRNCISDELIESQIKVLKELQKNTTDENELKLNKSKIDELNKNLIRISQYTPHAIAIICDLVVKEMISCGINQISQSGKKTLDTSYFYSSNFSESSLYPLIRTLPTYIDGNKLEDLTKKKVKKSDDEDAVQNDDGGDTDVEDSGSNMTFTTYINKAIIDVKKSFDIKLTIGTKVKKYLSDLLIELIKRLAVMTKSLLKNVINVRTIAPNHIKAIISLLLLDGNILDAEIEKLLLTIDEKVKLFQQAMVKELKTTDVSADAEVAPVLSVDATATVV